MLKEFRTLLEGVYMRHEMKFQPITKEILFTLLFTADEMKRNFVSEVVQEKRSFQ